MRWEGPVAGSGARSILEVPTAAALRPVQYAAGDLAVEQGWSTYYTAVEPALQCAAAGFVWQLLLQGGWDPGRYFPR